MDMHSLNLFGVPLEDSMAKDQLGNIAGSNAESQKALRELIELTDEIAGDTISNFNIRKSFVYYDPYDPDESVATAYLKFEDRDNLRASIVLDYYKNEIEAMRDDDLSFADKERK
jgi:hypothetical protein